MKTVSELEWEQDGAEDGVVFFFGSNRRAMDQGGHVVLYPVVTVERCYISKRGRQHHSKGSI